MMLTYPLFMQAAAASLDPRSCKVNAYADVPSSVVAAHEPAKFLRLSKATEDEPPRQTFPRLISAIQQA